MLIEDRNADRNFVVGGKVANDNTSSGRHVLVNEHRFAEFFGITGTVVTDGRGFWKFIDPYEHWAPLLNDDLPKSPNGTTGVVLQWKPRTDRLAQTTRPCLDVVCHAPS